MPITEGGTFSPDPRIVSPGVFTRENDVSGVAAGVANIGGAIVAPFAKGPAFSPVILTDATALANEFGNPDGVYYGPYTAAQYLKEQGIVTICRVGGLTGYKQNYPFAIWAVKGQYTRTGSFGALNSASSYVYFYGNSYNQYSESISWLNTSSKAMTINTASITVTFAGSAADDVTLSPTSNSGSLLYYGQTITLGTATVLYASSSVSQSQFSASIAAGTFSASITGPVPVSFPNAPYQFQSLVLVSGSLSVSLSTCGFPVILLSGVLTGSFGQYNGFTSNGQPTFNPCIGSNGAWVTSSTADMRLLAVLADTQAGGIQNLVCPGFYGSSLASTNPITSTTPSSTIPLTYNLTLMNSNSTTPYGIYQFSLNSSSPSYITNVFGNNPTAGNPAKQVTGQKIEAAYLYSIYEDVIADIIASSSNWSIVGSALPSGSLTGQSLNFTDQYSFAPSTGDSSFSISEAITPWIVSQAIAPYQSGSAAARYELFRIHTIADGTYTNTQFKVQISNIKLAGTVAGSDWG
jgi:hypothetical protein